VICFWDGRSAELLSGEPKEGDFVPAAELQAYYLRRPDAELKWKQQ
jgi:hypothetical protein